MNLERAVEPQIPQINADVSVCCHQYPPRPVGERGVLSKALILKCFICGHLRHLWFQG